MQSVSTIKIAFIVPYAAMKGPVEEIFDSHPDRGVISYSIITKTLEEINLQEIDTDILIARGWSAHLMKNSSVPFIDMTVTGFDITAALHSCIQQFNPDKIAIIGPLNTVYGIDEIKDVFPCALECYQVDEPESLSDTIQQALKDGCDAVISGRMGHLMCRSMAIPSVMIESGSKTIRQAVDEAVRYIRVMREERARTDRFQTIMDYSFEGILSVDPGGYITAINKHARSVLEQGESLKAPTHIRVLLPAIDVDSVLKREKRILGELVRINDRVYTLNCVPAGGSGAVLTFSNISKIQELEGQIRTKLHPKGLAAKYSFKDIVGADRLITESIATALKFGRVDSNIFIFGETGTGKELFAQSIHCASARADRPFVAINCAALSEDLLESELFGYVDGAFTGASKGGKAGLFELAHNGTIFLDEIGDISPNLQSKLLRVLQEREIMRLGHDRVIPVNNRIISASNKNLETLVSQGRFREDLFYRLNVLRLSLPPLRAHPGDIVPLCNHFIRQNREKFGCLLRALSPAAEELVVQHPWPGNVRELANFCERLCVLCEAELAQPQDVEACLDTPSNTVRFASEPDSDFQLAQFTSSWERELIQNALNSSSSKREAADRLGIDPSTLWRKMKKLNMQ